ncbi:MAG: MBL fold metallo-hydrolase [Pseudomonadales bacterium]|nr:MBL fold metallo-hydrolase [Pseudomonadales bacterium]
MTTTVYDFFDPETGSFSYLLVEEASGQAAIIDPLLNFDGPSGAVSCAGADAIVKKVGSLGVDVRWLLETHIHADHLSACAYLKKQFPAALSAIGQHVIKVQARFSAIFFPGSEIAQDGGQWDKLLGEGDELKLGESRIKILETPGHTPACLTYLVDGSAFVGDTLFMPDYGTARCDFPGGDAATLYHSIKKIFALDDATRIYFCHDYPPSGRVKSCSSSLGEQKKANIHIAESVSESEFTSSRIARDKQLSMPLLILPSLQVNIRAGQFPEPEQNGLVFLKIPLNIFE